MAKRSTSPSGLPRRVRDQPVAGPPPGSRYHVIEAVTPMVDCGRFPVKRVAGEPCVVEADIFRDGDHVLQLPQGKRVRSSIHRIYLSHG